jgi:hypothetical protein
MGVFNVAFQVLSRIPFVGDVVLTPYALKRAVPHIVKGQWRHAAAEVASCVAQAIGDDIIPVVGRDLGHEIVRLAVGRKYLPQRSLLLGGIFDRFHPKTTEALPGRPADKKAISASLPSDVS